jgi:proteic killer suppression protein
MDTVIVCHVIRSFANRGTEDIFDGLATRAARRTCPKKLCSIARRKLDQLNRVSDLADLGVPPGNRLERLRGDRAGQHSIRINERFGICFRWENGDAEQVEIVDYH